MKKKIFIGVGIAVLLFAAYVGYTLVTTRSHSPSRTTAFSHEGLDIKVVYCQPYKKGRLIFGEQEAGALQPFGKYWRLGANESTEITFSKDVNFAGKLLKAGTYRMYAVPGKDSWQVGLNSELGQWGAMEPNYALDVLKVEVPAGSASETEQFTINFSADNDEVLMDFVWDTTKITIPIAPA